MPCTVYSRIKNCFTSYHQTYTDKNLQCMPMDNVVGRNILNRKYKKKNSKHSNSIIYIFCVYIYIYRERGRERKRRSESK